MKQFGLAFLLAAIAQAAGAATILYGGGAATVDETLSDPTDLWVTVQDLPRVNGFELKPEGACLDEICVPLLAEERNNWIESDERGECMTTVSAHTSSETASRTSSSTASFERAVRYACCVITL